MCWQKQHTICCFPTLVYHALCWSNTSCKHCFYLVTSLYFWMKYIRWFRPSTMQNCFSHIRYGNNTEDPENRFLWRAKYYKKPQPLPVSLPFLHVLLVIFSLLALFKCARLRLFSLLELIWNWRIALCWFKPLKMLLSALWIFFGQFIETLLLFLSWRSFASVSLTDMSW